MLININVDTKDLSAEQRRGLASLLEAGNALGSTVVTGDDALDNNRAVLGLDEKVTEPTPIESAPSAPKRRTRKKAEPKLEVVEQASGDDPNHDNNPEESVPDPNPEDELEDLKQRAIEVASPIIRKGPGMKAKVLEVLQDLGVEKITALEGNREGLAQFIDRVQQIKA